ncbi:ABC-2 type transport system permease protein [Amphibacillus marinus]|uniref:ABC-2 type transport system permease protein n=1 Tax=Amphibacillus marinus TaxID=872970 RepID=A0A1H8K501_9BACI|nr:ABC transporter permease subunit [Amphibacillus marinus]SEN88119.1 ABC-2 type transport system permease protein [Amphibacillus marinus]
MLKLIFNEWEKIMRKKATYVMIGMTILAVIILSGGLKYIAGQYDTQDDNWQAVLEEENTYYQESLSTLENNQMQTYYERNIAINTYRLENNIPPDSEDNIWTVVEESRAIISLVGLFTIVVASGIVASEFSTGTIKLLLIRPISRVKILLSKYLTVILFSLFLLSITFGLAAIAGLILFGTAPEEAVHLAYQNGQVVERALGLHLMGSYLLYSIDILMLTTMAFMISSVFRNSSLAVGISIFLLTIGGTAANILSFYFDWAKYILFLNTDLTVYFDGMPNIEGMTLTFSIVMLLLYFVLFHLLAFFFFNKRDVAA